MSRLTMLASLVGGALMVSACAESIHQVQRDTELLGVPLGLEQEIDTTVRFAELKRSPGEYIGRMVMIGGNVIRAKRTEAGTEVEILQLPTASQGILTEDRLSSEGRFLAIREQFLDPASLPAGTPITVIGTVKGETTRQTKASTTTQFLRSNISSIGTASRRRDDEIEVHTTVPTTHPMDIAGSPPTVDFGGRMVATGEGAASMEAPAFIHQEVDPFPLLRLLRQALHPDLGVGSARSIQTSLTAERCRRMREKDEQTRCLLSRRQVMRVLGATSAAYLLDGRQAVAQTLAMPRSLCIVRPEQTEGPYFVDERLNRSDIRSDPTTGQITPGTPLSLTIHVSRIKAGDCQPLPSAQVDVWHCDARGIYSDVQDPGFDTTGQQFLRGYQTTDARGEARFLTIYPGWYPIRTVHIHFKIRTTPMAGRRYEFTSQVYFPDELTDRVHAATPYASQGVRRVKNRQDFIFRHDGEQLMLEPLETNGGYAATFPIGLAIPSA